MLHQQPLLPMLFPVPAASRLLGISRGEFCALLRMGVAESVPVGGFRRVPTAAVHDHVAELRNAVTRSAAERPA